MKRKPKKRRTRRGSSLAGYLAGFAVLAAVLLADHLRQSAPRIDAHPSASAVATERPDASDASRQSAPSESAAAPARPTSAEAALRTAAGGAAEAAPSVLSRHEAWPELPRYTGLVDTADLLCHT
ncbi:MAG: hypothetical protein K2N93_00240, partial [Alistipes sp.]|nr:hypothetical protein [Alistipes sp.]